MLWLMVIYFLSARAMSLLICLVVLDIIEDTFHEFNAVLYFLLPRRATKTVRGLN